MTNPLAATEGAPVENDADLRRRQSVSTALPSLTVLDGIIGAVASLNGVKRYKAYENDTSITDAHGIPSHTISMVVEGGDAQAIADAIMAKKTPGTGTYGTVQVSVVDVYGLTYTISFYRPTSVPISVGMTLKAFPGYTTTIEAAVKQAIVDYIKGLDINDLVSVIDYEPSGYSMETFSFDLDVPIVFKADAIQLAVLDQPVRSRNAHSVEYVCQNQPHTAWRTAVDAYKRIAPHILAS